MIRRMMMMMMVIKIITIIIELKGACQYSYNILTAQLCANYVQHKERLSRATCCVPRGTKGQLSYQFLRS